MSSPCSRTLIQRNCPRVGWAKRSVPTFGIRVGTLRVACPEAVEGPTLPGEVMSHYRRGNETGAPYFFTLAIEDRASGLLVIEIDRLRKAYRTVEQRYPFETVAICILPDHLHAIWHLPKGDAAFGQRWSLIKRNFSTALPTSLTRTESKIAKREKGIWQRRFWEHQIRDDADLERHVDYIHYNPVKHGLVAGVNDRPHSSFHRFVKSGLLTEDWGGRHVEGNGEFGEVR